MQNFYYIIFFCSNNIDKNISQQRELFIASTNSSKNGAALRCVQCGQGNLQDAEADCEKQIVVECNRRGTRLAKEEQYFCFTRQILIGPGE
uniref:Uncharacterized protein n=1 Tax=Ascaris lumbricoides TaxID=6252 RepID=A0A0M3HHE4_ASCLU